MIGSTEQSLERGALVRLTCGPMVHGGACLAKTGDTTVFVDGAIPGEEVIAELRYRKKQSWFARVTDVITPSPDRVEAPCKYFGHCGGCQLQHIAYERQLELKREIVEDALRRQHVQHGALRVHGAHDPWKYRWRGEFHVMPGGELGFNAQRSWTPIAIDDCLIHHSTINDSLPVLRRLVREGSAKTLTALHLTVGAGGDELLVSGKPKAALDQDAVDRLARDAPHRWSTTQTLLSWDGRTFAVTPEAFIQVNQDQAKILYRCVTDALADAQSRRIVDAYAGIGILSILVAATADSVTCIENNKSAVAMGRLNAEMNGVHEVVHYVCDSVESALPGVLRDTSCDAVILDPPRAGCESSVIALLALAGPKKVIYVSCDPSTLARDLKVLTHSGPYTVDSIDVVDMFSHTYHVETVVVLTR